MASPVQHGDWLALAPTLERGCVDFLYTDPPFNTGRQHRTPPRARNRAAVEASSFKDVFESTAAYILWLRKRLAATLPALKPSAIVAIHCDFRISHHVRLLLDDLLTPDNFVNHLIWHYGLGGSSPRRFARKHDDILVYCLDPALYYFDPPMVPATSNRLKGKMKKATDVMRVPADALLDLPSLNNMSHERTGYPTQKPLALLDMLVQAFCPPGGTVLDPTCGSGTALVAAKRAGRQPIGFDASPDAVALATKRLHETTT